MGSAYYGQIILNHNSSWNRDKISTPSDISQVQSIIVEFEPDVLLFDVHLKNANGLDLANKLRIAGELDNRILIMASGMDLEKECKQAGASLFLLKPYHPDHLINWLRDHI